MKKITIVNENSGVFFRSESNGWSTNQQFSEMSNGTLKIKGVTMNNGMNQFKIADSNWSGNCNFGYTNHTPVMLNHKYTLENNVNDNITMWANDTYNVDITLYKNADGYDMQIRASKK